MPDEQTPGLEAQNKASADAASGTQGGADQSGKTQRTLESALAEIEELRKENAKRRVSEKAAQDAAAAREQAVLAEQGRFKELYESEKSEREKLTPYQQQASDLQKVISDGNAERIALIPEPMRGLVPTGYPAAELHKWLNANLSLLTRKPAPDLNAGEGMGGSGNNATALTDEEKQMAAMMGISLEAFAKQKSKK